LVKMSVCVTFTAPPLVVVLNEVLAVVVVEDTVLVARSVCVVVLKVEEVV